MPVAPKARRRLFFPTIFALPLFLFGGLSVRADIGDAVDQEDLTWTSGGSSNLASAPLPERVDGDALLFFRVDAENSAWVETTIQGPSRVSFQWRAIELDDSSGVELTVNGENEILFSRSQGWNDYSFELSATGPNTVRWLLFDNAELPFSENSVWLDGIEIEEIPIIIEHPLSQSIKSNGTRTLSIVATEATPNTYQWFKNGEELPGETAASLELVDVIPEDAGVYHAIVSNANGSSRSRDATITVYDNFGASVEQASWTWVTFIPNRWTPQTEVSQDGEDALAFIPGPPSDQHSILSSVEGAGALSFWWKFDSPGLFDSLFFEVDASIVEVLSRTSDWIYVEHEIAVNDFHTLKWTLNDDSNKNVEVSGAWIDQIRFEPRPIITDQPTDSLVNEGEAVSLSVVAASSTALSYQWRKDGVDIPGANAGQLTIDPASLLDDGVYDVIISNTGYQATSNTAKLFVAQPIDDALNQPDLDWDTLDQPYWRLQSTETRDGELALEGRERHARLQTNVEGPVTISFWWRIENNEATAYFEIDSSTKANVENKLEWTQEIIRIADPGIHQLTWNYTPDPYNEDRVWIDLLEFDYAPFVVEDLYDKTALLGGNASFSISAASGATPSYQWFKDEAELPNSNQATLDLLALAPSDAGSYRVLVSNENGSVSSITAELELYENFGDSIEQPALTWTMNSNESILFDTEDSLDGVDAARFQSKIEPDWIETSLEGPFTLSFWWKRTGGCCTTFNLLANGQPMAQLGDESDRWLHERIAFDETGVHTIRFQAQNWAETSGSVLLDRVSISRPPAIEAPPANTIFQQGDALSLSVSANGEAPLSYQWFKDGQAIEKATSSSLSIPNADFQDSGYYKVRVSNDNGFVDSQTAFARVSNPLGDALDQPELQWTTSDDSAWYTQNSISLDGEDTLETRLSNEAVVQWLETTIDGPATVSFLWRLIGESTQFSFFVDEQIAYWLSEPTLWTPSSFEILEPGPHTIRWELSGFGDSASEIAWLDTVEISRKPIISAQPSAQLIAIDQAFSLAVEAASSSPLSYQWIKDETPLPGETNAILNRSGSLDELGVYRVEIANENGAVSSETAIIESIGIVNEGLDIVGLDWQVVDNGIVRLQSYQTTDGEDALLLETEDTIELETVFNGPAHIEIDWRLENGHGGGVNLLVDDRNLISDNSDSDWETARLLVNEAGAHTLTFRLYRFEGSETDVKLYLDQLRIHQAPIILRHPESGILQPDAPQTLSVIGQSGSSISYQWRKDGSPIDGATESTFSILNPTETDAGSYDAVLSNANGTVVTRLATLIYVDQIAQALDTGAFSLELGGSGRVAIDTESASDEEDALRIEVDAGETLWLEAPSNVPAKISFWWRSAPSNCDNSASIRTGDSYLDNINGATESDWQRFEWDGAFDDAHPFAWIFQAGDECPSVFYLDQVSVEYDPIVEQPDELAGIVGEPLTLSIEWRDDFTGPFQWRKNGQPIEGATGPELSIESYADADSGEYDVAFEFGSDVYFSNPISAQTIQNIGEPIDAPELTWAVSSWDHWIYDTDIAWDGEESLEMRSENRYEPTWIETIVEGPALVSFKWWIGWNSCDAIFFYVDDEPVREYSRRIQQFEWREVEYIIDTPGPHTLRWGLLDKDCDYRSVARLDDVRISRGPIFNEHPRSKIVEIGSETILDVATRSETDTFQWRRDGEAIPGATGPTFAAATPGAYDVVASNAVESSISNIAQVEFIPSLGHLVEQPNLAWEIEPNTHWLANDSLYTKDGDSLSSPELPLGGNSTFHAFIEGPANFSFDYRIFRPSSAQAFIQSDTLSFYDTLEMDDPSDQEWKTYRLAIEEPGLHRVSLRIYVHEPQIQNGDAPYASSPKLLVDNFRISQAPLIARHPADTIAYIGEEVAIDGSAFSTIAGGPLAYQWYKDNIPIEGSNSPSLLAPSVSEGDSGSYVLVVSNAAGSVTSQAAQVTVIPNLANALGQTGISLFSEIESPWNPERNENGELEFVARLDPQIGGNTGTRLEAGIIGPGTLSFNWSKEDSGSDVSLTYSLDGYREDSGSRSPSQGRESLYIPEGSHLFTWNLTTDYQEAEGSITDIRFIQGAPFVRIKAFSANTLQGSDIALDSETQSHLPVAYQWFKDDIPIDGATESSLALDSITLEDTGFYRLQATNAEGSHLSEPWRLDVSDKPNFVVGQSNLQFDLEGNDPWAMRSSSRGFESITSPLLDPGESSALKTTITGPARIRFRYNAFFTSPGNRFDFLVNGQVLASFDDRSYSGQFTHEILEDGEHILEWRLSMNPFEVDSGRGLSLRDLEVETDLLSVYAEWSNLVFDELTTESDRALDSDPDGDTKVNLLEFLIGSDPLLTDGPIAVAPVTIDGVDYWRLELELIAWVNGIEFAFETSSDLETWDPVETEFDLQDNGESATLILLGRVPESLDSSPFTRVKLGFDASSF